MKKPGITELKRISGGNSDNRRLEDMTARSPPMGIAIKITYEELMHPKPAKLCRNLYKAV